MNKSALTLRSLALCTLLLPGCYTTTIASGKPAAPASIQYDERWHQAVVWGIAELSGPYDLEKICPHGWSEITTETSFLNGFVDSVTSGMYNPQNVTVRCAVSAPSGGLAHSDDSQVAAPADWRVFANAAAHCPSPPNVPTAELAAGTGANAALTGGRTMTYASWVLSLWLSS